MATGNENPNWTLNIPPLAGVTPFDPTRVKPDNGAYPVVITAATEYTKNPEGTKSIKFTNEIAEGKLKGTKVDIYMPFDKIHDAGSINQRAWLTLLLSTGAPIQVMAQGHQLGPNTFVGKRAYIYVLNAPEGEQGGKDKRNYVTMEQYTTLVAQAQQQAAQAGAASSAGAPRLGAPAGTPPQAFGVPPMAGAVPQPQGNLASPGGALAGAGLPPVQNGMTQLAGQAPAAAPGLPGAAPAPAGGVTW